MMLAQYFDDVVVVGVAAVAVAVSVADALLRSGRFCCVLFSSAQLRSGIAGSGLVWSGLFCSHSFFIFIISFPDLSQWQRILICSDRIYVHIINVLTMLLFFVCCNFFLVLMHFSYRWLSRLLATPVRHLAYGFLGDRNSSLLVWLGARARAFCYRFGCKKTHTIQPNKLYCRVLCSTIDNALNTEKM